MRAILILLVLLIIGCASTTVEENKNTSPYSGQESRDIKSLSQDDIDGLKAGLGTPFGGIAKLAELNGYPGPRHVLDLSAELNLNESQISETKRIFNEMNSKAITLGEQLIQIEQRINDRFDEKTMEENYLESKLNESSQIYSKLRYVHLNAHIEMTQILTKSQIEKYNEIRGYSNPCENIPEGHPEDMWKLHHNCP